MSKPLDAALSYAARGWPVVALHTPVQTGEKPVCSCPDLHTCPHIGKHPRFHRATLAHGAHSATTNAGTIREWWGRWPDANVGIAVGPRAGLLALDIDPRNGGDDTWAALLAELGPLPATVEAQTGGGGRHLLFKHPGGVVAGGGLGAGVDVLGSDGQLIVAEPSLHKGGKRYCWELSSAPDMVVVAELPEVWKAKILRADAVGEDRGYRENREDRESGQQGTQPTPVDPAIPVTPAPADPEWTEDRLFKATLPTGRGQHDRCSLNLARGAKLHLGYATPEAARAMFDRWWDRAAPFCAEHDADTAWFKFVRGFEAARIPLGATDLVAVAFEAAKRGPLPKAADRFRTDRMRLLVGVCWHMQRLAGGPFKMSCHQLAKMYGVHPNQPWEWLCGLEKSLVVRRLDRGRGGAVGGKAATFAYIGDDLPT